MKHVAAQWRDLFDKHIFYPGLAGSTSFIRVWRDDPTVVSPLLNKMVLTAGAWKMNKWKYWQRLEDPTWSSSKSFLEAWRELNPGDLDVAESRICSRKELMRFVSILMLCDSCDLPIPKPRRRCKGCRLIY